MSNKINKNLVYLTTAIFFGLLIVGAAFVYSGTDSKERTHSTKESEKPTTNFPKDDRPPVESTESYQGVPTVVANNFTIKVPNGWRASISENPNFLAIMFARPNQLESLVYKADSEPIVDANGIPSWSGLTEHFFIIKPNSAQAFSPKDHLEISSLPFTFNDGTVGLSYYVVKRADEAKKWGGLQKDTEWQGRTYIYEKDGKKVEAHLALYPSSGTSIRFFENVIRTLTF